MFVRTVCFWPFSDFKIKGVGQTSNINFLVIVLHQQSAIDTCISFSYYDCGTQAKKVASMKPITVEFTAKAGDQEFKEESITFQNPNEFFAFVAPGGGCDAIPDEVGEINVVFLKPEHANTQNPVADKRVTLELGMVFITGPLAEIVQTAEQIIDKAGRGELTESFLKVINVSH